MAALFQDVTSAGTGTTLHRCGGRGGASKWRGCHSRQPVGWEDVMPFLAIVSARLLAWKTSGAGRDWYAPCFSFSCAARRPRGSKGRDAEGCPNLPPLQGPSGPRRSARTPGPVLIAIFLPALLPGYCKRAGEGAGATFRGDFSAGSGRRVTPAQPRRRWRRGRRGGSGSRGRS